MRRYGWEAVSFTGLAPSGPDLVATTSPSLTWDAISGADYVEVQTAGSEAALSSAATVQASRSPHALSVSKGETVYWCIRPHFSVNGGYYGDWSPVQSFTVVAYTVGETGPAGGTIISVDSAGDHTGWDYMEAAPSYTEWPMNQYAWGAHTQTTGATGTAVGTGASNTAMIVAWLNGNTDDTYGDVTSKNELRSMGVSSNLRHNRRSERHGCSDTKIPRESVTRGYKRWPRKTSKPCVTAGQSISGSVFVYEVGAFPVKSRYPNEKHMAEFLSDSGGRWPSLVYPAATAYSFRKVDRIVVEKEEEIK